MSERLLSRLSLPVTINFPYIELGVTPGIETLHAVEEPMDVDFPYYYSSEETVSVCQGKDVVSFPYSTFCRLDLMATSTLELILVD